MPLGTTLELPEHELDDGDWSEEDEEFGADGDELNLDEYDEDLEEEDATEEL
jgi:hypothetical protein